MERRDPQSNGPDPKLKKAHGYDKPETESIRDGGDDALSADPDDARLDEKVIVNEQRSEKVTNVPAQSGINSSEVSGNDDEILEDRR
jgi:hypothetical protein